MSDTINKELVEALAKAPMPTGADLFAAAGTTARLVPGAGDPVKVVVPGLDHVLWIPRDQWERYLELCKRWQASPKDEAGARVAPRRISREDLACIHDALERELGELATMVAAAGTTLDQVDAEDALALVLRRLEQARKALTDLRGAEITTGKEAADDAL
jgi:hypothetical protein